MGADSGGGGGGGDDDDDDDENDMIKSKSDQKFARRTQFSLHLVIQLFFVSFTPPPPTTPHHTTPHGRRQNVTNDIQRRLLAPGSC